ncbi:MAG: hypothetical protein AABO41_27475 [Acidobacteriota bacterium]
MNVTAGALGAETAVDCLIPEAETLSNTMAEISVSVNVSAAKTILLFIVSPMGPAQPNLLSILASLIMTDETANCVLEALNSFPAKHITTTLESKDA